VNYIGYAGVLSIIGREGDRPVIPGVQIGDLAGGGMSAVIAVLAALHRRSSAGEGDFCDISMMDGAVSWLSIHAGEYFATGNVPSPERMHLSGEHPCYRLYPAADGWLTVGALEPQFWAALCTALERPDLSGDAFAAGERRDEVIRELEGLFRTKTRAEWMQHLGDKDVCVGPVNDLAEAAADPQVAHRAMMFQTEVPGAGPWQHIGNPVKMTGAPGKIDRLPPPLMGEHTDQILLAAGLDEASIASLRAAGAI
jgi:crotonobetainyl-CoA:carnitine CoA-transferase CaiB-like acyl-CoA transferase